MVRASGPPGATPQVSGHSGPSSDSRGQPATMSSSVLRWKCGPRCPCPVGQPPCRPGAASVEQERVCEPLRQGKGAHRRRLPGPSAPAPAPSYPPSLPRATLLETLHLSASLPLLWGCRGALGFPRNSCCETSSTWAFTTTSRKPLEGLYTLPITMATVPLDAAMCS